MRSCKYPCSSGALPGSDTQCHESLGWEELPLVQRLGSHLKHSSCLRRGTLCPSRMLVTSHFPGRLPIRDLE